MCIVRKEADAAWSSEKIQINSVMLAVFRTLGGLLWYLHEHYRNHTDDSESSTTGLQREKCSELLICNLQMDKKQKPDFPSVRSVVVLNCNGVLSTHNSDPSGISSLSSFISLSGKCISGCQNCSCGL